MSGRNTLIRRTLILGLLVILLVVLGLPAVLGWQLSRVHDRYVQQLSIPGLLEVRGSAFSRGILRSKSRVRLAPDNAFCGNSACPEVVVDSIIHHGPIPFTAPPTTRGGLQVGRGVIVSQADLTTLFAHTTFKPALPAMELVTRVDLAGATSATLKVPAARLNTESEDVSGRVSMDSLEAGAQLPASQDALRGSLLWPAFKLVADEGGQLGLQGLAVEFSGNASAPLFWQRLGVKLSGLQIVDSQGESLSLQGLIWDANNIAEPNARLASEFSLRLSQLAMRNRQYGPVIVEGRVQGLDVASIQAIQAQVRALNPQALPPELLLLAVTGIYKTHVPELLAADPKLRISRLLASTPDGDVVASLTISLAKSDNGGVALANVLRRLELTADLRMPAPMLKALVRSNLRAEDENAPPPDPQDVEKALAALTEGKYVIAKLEENAYLVNVRIENQNLTINGEVREGWQTLLDTLEQETDTATPGEPILGP